MRATARRASNQWRWQKLSRSKRLAMVNGFVRRRFTQVCAAILPSRMTTRFRVWKKSDPGGILPGGCAWTSCRRSTSATPFTMQYRALSLRRQAGPAMASSLSHTQGSCARRPSSSPGSYGARSPAAMRYTKEAIRAVRFMKRTAGGDISNPQMSDALKYMDKATQTRRGRNNSRRKDLYPLFLLFRVCWLLFFCFGERDLGLFVGIVPALAAAVSVFLVHVLKRHSLLALQIIAALTVRHEGTARIASLSVAHSLRVFSISFLATLGRYPRAASL